MEGFLAAEIIKTNNEIFLQTISDRTYRALVCLLCDFKHGKTAEDLTCLCNVFREGVILMRHCQRFSRRFREGDGSLAAEEHGRRPELLDSEALKEAIEPDSNNEKPRRFFRCSQRNLHHFGRIAQALPCVGVDTSTTTFLHDKARTHQMTATPNSGANQEFNMDAELDADLLTVSLLYPKKARSPVVVAKLQGRKI
ncbi:hypothetical protein OESDEN_08388 [Oesophagostomum dentatum]|uniref:Mos1 transposase HTH domain-containing protein n=1 Tax=Oesophagostomum dentatum TaxID=61180 RepID=A0A0B1T8P1_OESDE|nr:hypothetical protein OESDEN_08388 [Oesophagostomum dentatum]